MPIKLRGKLNGEDFNGELSKSRYFRNPPQLPFPATFQSLTDGTAEERRRYIASLDRLPENVDARGRGILGGILFNARREDIAGIMGGVRTSTRGEERLLTERSVISVNWTLNSFYSYTPDFRAQTVPGYIGYHQKQYILFFESLWRHRAHRNDYDTVALNLHELDHAVRYSEGTKIGRALLTAIGIKRNGHNVSLEFEGSDVQKLQLTKITDNDFAFLAKAGERIEEFTAQHEKIGKINSKAIGFLRSVHELMAYHENIGKIDKTGFGFLGSAREFMAYRKGRVKIADTDFAFLERIDELMAYHNNFGAIFQGLPVSKEAFFRMCEMYYESKTAVREVYSHSDEGFRNEKQFRLAQLTAGLLQDISVSRPDPQTYLLQLRLPSIRGHVEVSGTYDPPLPVAHPA